MFLLWAVAEQLSWMKVKTNDQMVGDGYRMDDFCYDVIDSNIDR